MPRKSAITLAVVFGGWLVAGVAAGASTTVTCVSEPGERRECPADTSAGVALARDTGTAACLLGVNWGYGTTGVWVSDGCGGQFTLGQAAPGKKEKGFVGHYDLYGLFRAHLAFFNEETEIQNSASWIGLDYATGDEIKLFARWEWGVNVIRGGTQFSQGASTSGGLYTLGDDPTETPLLANRLGYVGVDLGAGGRLSLGKQKSLHYDIAHYTTDRPNVFSGEGSIAYPANSDGGPSGTGRIDQAMIYRLKVLEIVEFGGQMQFLTAQNDEFLDGWGASVQVTILPELKVGGALTDRYFSQQFKDDVVNLQGSANYRIVGADYSSDLLDLAGVWATQRNGDISVVEVLLPGGQVALVPVSFDADGVEIYGKVKLGRLALQGGFVSYVPRNLPGLLHPDLRTRYFRVGAEWNLKENGFAYTEWRLDDSVDARGTQGFDVFTFGLRYGFSMKGTHGTY
jgi:predicted porin